MIIGNAVSGDKAALLRLHLEEESGHSLNPLHTLQKSFSYCFVKDRFLAGTLTLSASSAPI